MEASTLQVYREVLMADVLLCRSPHLASSQSCKDKRPPPNMPFRGIHPFSQVPARRIGFSGVPVSTLVVIHISMLLRSPCSAAVLRHKVIAMMFLVTGFTV